MLSKKVIMMLGSSVVVFMTGCGGVTTTNLAHDGTPNIDGLFDIACQSSSLERIIANTSEAIRQDSSCVDCFLLRAVSWLRIGQLDEAYADIRRAAYIDPVLFPAVKALHTGRFSYRTLIDKFLSLDQGRLAQCDCVSDIIFSTAHAALSPASESSGATTDNRVKNVTSRESSPHRICRTDSTSSVTLSAGDDEDPKNKAIQTKSSSDTVDVTSSPQIPDPVDVQQPHDRITSDDNNKQDHEPSGQAPILDSCTIKQARQSNSPDVYLCVAKRLYKNREYKQVLAITREAVKVDKSFAEIHLLRAKTYGAVHRYRKALRSVNKAIRYEPTNSSHYLVQAWIYHCLGRFKKERGSLHIALQKGSDKRPMIELRLKNIADK